MTGKPVNRKRRVLFSILIFVAAVAAVELGIRAVYSARNARIETVPVPYFAAHTYAELPPWYDGLRSLEWDAELIWKTRPGIKRRYLNVFTAVGRMEDRIALEQSFIPREDAMQSYPTWEMTINSLGFRDDEFPETKRDGVLRIVCMGDSWTFSVNADQTETYPKRLEARLRDAYPELDVEVLNVGVMGYSSYQGLKLLERTVLDLEPDLVVVGYGMNDGQLSSWPDEQINAFNRGIVNRVRRTMRKSEILKLARYIGKRLTKRQKPLEARIEAVAMRAAEADAAEAAARSGTDEVELPAARVSPADFERNLRELLRIAREGGAAAILMHNELRGIDGVAPPLEGAYRRALVEISEDLSIPLVDTSSIVADERARIERDLETRLGLAPSEDGATDSAPEEEAAEASVPTVVFRLFMDGYDVDGHAYISGDHPRLGDSVPNAVAMHDDGNHGDQVAGDGVWSLAVPLPAGRTFAYVFTNGGEEGVWEGLDVPYVRTLSVPVEATGTIHAPIATFGQVYMQTDASHTGAAGYDAMAERLLAAIETLPAFREHVAPEISR